MLQYTGRIRKDSDNKLSREYKDPDGSFCWETIPETDIDVYPPKLVYVRFDPRGFHAYTAIDPKELTRDVKYWCYELVAKYTL